MADINRVLDEIEILRKKLENLIQTKGDLQDQEVIQASVYLDNALNIYNKLTDSSSTKIRRVS